MYLTQVSIQYFVSCRALIVLYCIKQTRNLFMCVTQIFVATEDLETEMFSRPQRLMKRCFDYLTLHNDSRRWISSKDLSSLCFWIGCTSLPLPFYISSSFFVSFSTRFFPLPSAYFSQGKKS